VRAIFSPDCADLPSDLAPSAPGQPLLHDAPAGAGLPPEAGTLPQQTVDSTAALHHSGALIRKVVVDMAGSGNVVSFHESEICKLGSLKVSEVLLTS